MWILSAAYLRDAFNAFTSLLLSEQKSSQTKYNQTI